jgi:hypothetical protein
VGIRLGMTLRIKYDGTWLCRGDRLFLEENFVPACLLHTSAV